MYTHKLTNVACYLMMLPCLMRPLPPHHYNHHNLLLLAIITLIQGRRQGGFRSPIPPIFFFQAGRKRALGSLLVNLLSSCNLYRHPPTKTILATTVTPLICGIQRGRGGGGYEQKKRGSIIWREKTRNQIFRIKV